MSVNQLAIDDAVSIAKATDDEWPNSDKEGLGRSDMHTGGLWATLPTLRQIPTGLRYGVDVDVRF